jgi:hypothetical protein
MLRDSDLAARQACYCTGMFRFMATALQTRPEGHYFAITSGIPTQRMSFYWALPLLEGKFVFMRSCCIL